MELALEPPHGVGPLRVGMTVEEARSALETVGTLAPTAYGELALDMPTGLRISVGFGVAGRTLDRVNSIEVWRPREGDIVRYRDIDVFGLPALEVVERLQRHVHLVPDTDGECFTAPELFLAFWRPFAENEDPREEQGHFFQSVLVARPGYDDGPGAAEARLAADGEPGY